MKNTNTAISFVIAFAVAFMAIPAFGYALTTAGSGTTGGTASAAATGSVTSTPGPIAPPPATASAGTTAGTVTTPGTGTAGTTAGTVTTPGTGTAGTTAGTATTPGTGTAGTTAGDGSTGGTGTTPGGTTPGSDNGGIVTAKNATSGGGGYISGGMIGGALPALTSIGQCAYITTHLKMGLNNSIDEMVKLQTFLKNTESMNVVITGNFDAQTLTAVNAFQAKYAVDVLLPWGISTPTGHVYHTTMKKINEIYCKTTFSLTPAQIAEIERYRTSVQNGTAPTSDEVGSNSGANGTSNSGTTGIAGATTSSDSQVAASAKIPLIVKIWNFIKRIFGR